MKQIYKQMIVMLFSTLFLVVVAIVVLSSNAGAQATHPDRIDDMLQSADDHLSEQNPHVTATFSGECVPAHHTTPYFGDEPVVYNSDQYEIDRLNDELESMRHNMAINDGYDTDFSDRITKGIWALIIIAIIGFIIWCIFGDASDVPEPRRTPEPYLPTLDTSNTSSADQYDRQAAQAEIEKEWK